MTVPQWQRRRCRVGGRLVRLSPLAIELLAVLLVRDPAGFVSLNELIEALWHPDLEPEYPDRVVSHYVIALRRLGIPIENERGFGWRIPEWARGTDELRLAA
jgi:DNA-binding response OmpR family regulator